MLYIHNREAHAAAMAAASAAKYAATVANSALNRLLSAESEVLEIETCVEMERQTQAQNNAAEAKSNSEKEDVNAPSSKKQRVSVDNSEKDKETTSANATLPTKTTSSSVALPMETTSSSVALPTITSPTARPTYKCKICGQPKAGHTCPGHAAPQANTTPTTKLPAGGTLPAALLPAGDSAVAHFFSRGSALGRATSLPVPSDLCCADITSKDQGVSAAGATANAANPQTSSENEDGTVALASNGICTNANAVDAAAMDTVRLSDVTDPSSTQQRESVDSAEKNTETTSVAVALPTLTPPTGRNMYKCKICGQPKAGHTCPGSTSNLTSATILPPPAAAHALVALPSLSLALASAGNIRTENASVGYTRFQFQVAATKSQTRSHNEDGAVPLAPIKLAGSSAGLPPLPSARVSSSPVSSARVSADVGPLPGGDAAVPSALSKVITSGAGTAGGPPVQIASLASVPCAAASEKHSAPVLAAALVLHTTANNAVLASVPCAAASEKHSAPLVVANGGALLTFRVRGLKSGQVPRFLVHDQTTLHALIVTAFDFFLERELKEGSYV